MIFSPRGDSIRDGRTKTSDVPSRLWRTSDGKTVETLERAYDRVSAVAFDPRDGRSFVTGSYDRTCRLWAADTGAADQTGVSAFGGGPRGGL